MQAADAGVSGAVDRAPRHPGRRCPGGSGTEAAAAGGIHHVARSPQAPGSGIDAAPTDRRPGMRPHVFALSVPFPTPLEAEIARGSLAPDGEPHQGVIGKELTVSGSILAIRWTAEDSRLLRISILNFLEQLSLVVRTMQRFGPPVSR